MGRVKGGHDYTGHLLIFMETWGCVSEGCPWAWPAIQHGAGGSSSRAHPPSLPTAKPLILSSVEGK